MLKLILITVDASHYCILKSSTYLLVKRVNNNKNNTVWIGNIINILMESKTEKEKNEILNFCGNWCFRIPLNNSSLFHYQRTSRTVKKKKVLFNALVRYSYVNRYTQSLTQHWLLNSYPYLYLSLASISNSNQNTIQNLPFLIYV